MMGGEERGGSEKKGGRGTTGGNGMEGRIERREEGRERGGGEVGRRRRGEGSKTTPGGYIEGVDLMDDPGGNRMKGPQIRPLARGQVRRWEKSGGKFLRPPGVIGKVRRVGASQEVGVTSKPTKGHRKRNAARGR